MLCGAPNGSVCVDKRVQFGYPANLSLDFALCSQKSTQNLLKSTHAKGFGNQLLVRASRRQVRAVTHRIENASAATVGII